MRSNIIMYMPGHAGNFLARLFSLGDETLPQMPVYLLDEVVRTGRIPREFNRVELYSFSRVSTVFADWQEFHRAWADLHNQTEFELLNVFYQGKVSMTYCIHPHELKKFKSKINQLDQNHFYYVDLDLSRYGSWVKEQQEKLKFVLRENEQQDFLELKKIYNMKRINLTKMLESEKDFLEEYLMLCDQMNLVACEKPAIELYQDWYRTRGL